MTINYDYQVNSTNYNTATTTFHFRVVSRGAGGGGTTGVVVDDFDTASGTKTCDGNITTITIGVKEQTGTEGTRNFTLEVADNAGFTGKVTKDIQVTDGGQIFAWDDGASFTITETASSRNFDFTVTGNPTSGTVYWNITTDQAGTTQAGAGQFSAVNSGGTGVSYTSGAGTVPVDATADATTEGDITYYLQLRTGSDTGTIVDTLDLTVTDDSTTPVSGSYLTLVASPTSLVEASGTAAAFTLTSSGITNGTTVGFTIVDSTLDPQPDASTTPSDVLSNPSSGDSWYYDDGQYGWRVDDTNSITYVVWGGTNVGTLPTTGPNAGSNPGTYQSITEAEIGGFIYEQGHFIGSGWNSDGTSGETHAVRRRSATGQGIAFDEWEYSTDNVSYTTGSAGGLGSNTQGMESAYHGSFTMSSNTDVVYLRALDEGETEGSQTFTIRLHDTDSGATSTGNLEEDLTVTDPAVTASFAFDPTDIQTSYDNISSGGTTDMSVLLLRNGDANVTRASFGSPVSNSTTPAIDNSGADTNWASPQGSFFGDNYQIQVNVYTTSAKTSRFPGNNTRTDDTNGNFGSYDTVFLYKGSTLLNGNEAGVTNVQWEQDDTNPAWFQMNDDIIISHAVAVQGVIPGGNATIAQSGYVEFIIKEYSGTLGTGTTVLTAGYDFFVSAKNF